jgi:diaminohydroxyphosphoribosylaminopyrimidine deaminase/5-amino-6-(5-phosphoribosylamino)uracil reductase
VLTGIGTVKDDNPRLTVRDVPTTRQPLRVVIDSRLETPLDAAVLEGGKVLIAAAREDAERAAALRARGAEIVILPNAGGKVDLPNCCRNSDGAASTKCWPRPARGSTARCCAKAASTNC